MHNYYDILDVDSSASLEDIKKAYRRLAQRYHPDRNSDPEAVEKFRQVRQAYEALMASHIPKQAKKKQADTATEHTSATSTESAETFWPKWKKTVSAWDDAYAIYLNSIRYVFREKVRAYQALRRGKYSVDFYQYRIRQLGAYAAAQSKVAKRHFVLEMLRKANNEGMSNVGFAIAAQLPTNPLKPVTHIPQLDITPTLANNCAKQLLGRGFDRLILNAMFGTPGRTAADKTKTQVEHLSTLMAVCRQGLQDLDFSVAEIRSYYRILYEFKKQKH